MALATFQIEALQTRWFYASSLERFAQSFLFRAQLKTRCPEIGSMSSLSVVVHVFSKPSVSFRHGWGGVVKRRSLRTSRSVAKPTMPCLDELHGYNSEVEAAPQFYR